MLYNYKAIMLYAYIIIQLPNGEKERDRGGRAAKVRGVKVLVAECAVLSIFLPVRPFECVL